MTSTVRLTRDSSGQRTALGRIRGWDTSGGKVTNNLERQWRDATRVVLSLQARSVEIDSPITRVELAWDGKWEDGDKEMGKHLVVKQLK